jgi:ELWxxDGT repeat protein
MERRILLSIQLVGDINTGLDSSSPSVFVTSGALTYFTATDGVHGRELWRTDGTADGTRMVKDIYPGPGDNVIAKIVNVNGVVYFRANDPVNGAELWKSDGTEAGTVLVKDIIPGQGGPSMDLMGAVGDKLILQVRDSAHGSELWVSDGTDAGTTLIKDIRPGTSGSNIGGDAAIVLGHLCFFADDGVHGSELWTTDGTPAGTQMLVDAVTGSSGSGPAALHTIGTRIFAENGVVTDGTPQGTAKVPLGAFDHRMLDIGGGRAVWTDGNLLFLSDGTEAGTAAYFDIRTVQSGMFIRSLASAGGLAYFWTSASQTGTALELWKTDGTKAGTMRVVQPSVFFGGFNYQKHATVAGVGNELFFFIERNGTGVELWRTDGTEAGTRLLQIVNTGFADTESLGRLGGFTLFDGNDPTVGGRELWRTDGTPGGTALVSEINPGTGDANPTEPTRVGAGNAIVFAAPSPNTGAEVRTKDPSGSGGVQLLADIRPGISPSSPYGFVRFGDYVYFFATSAASTSELDLFRTDGTPQGTTFVSAVGSPDSLPLSFPRSVVMGGTLYFFVRAKAGAVMRLWATDGTQAGTVMIREFSSSFEPYPTVMGSRLYFAAGDAGDTELWSSDGTTAGTTRVIDLRTGTSASTPRYLTAIGNTLYFGADNGTKGNELWKSDGTAGGTAIVADLNPGSPGSSPSRLYAYDGVLYFTANDALGASALWRTDGSTTGTQQLFAGFALGLQGIGGQLFFIGDPGELFVTDGLPGHAHLVKDVNGTAASSIFGNVGLTAFGGAVYFVADDGVNGLELWRSDGTTSGTVIVRDLAPGTGGAFDKPLAVVGNRLYVAASDGISGQELWVLTDEAPPRVTSVNWTSDTSISVRFTEDVGASLTADELMVGGTNGVMNPNSVAFDTGSQTATFSFSSPLPDGDYTATLAAGAATDGAGNTLAQAFSNPFFVLAGDANRDRSVDFLDLARLAQNYNTTGGKTYAQGDFNGDGNVDFLDLAIMAQRYNTNLPPGAAQPVAAPSTSFAADWAAATATIPAPVAAKADPTKIKPKPLFSVAPVVKPPSKPKAKPQQRR